MLRIRLVALLAVLVAPPLAAQDTSRAVGLGVSINPGALIIEGEGLLLFQTGFNNLLLPIRGAKLTVEPEFGLSRIVNKREQQTGPTTFTTITDRASSYRLGVGILKHLERREGLEPYVGPRLGLIRVTNSTEQPNFDRTVKVTSWYLSGVVGGQYFFTTHFTLGAEGQLTYSRLGRPEITGASFTPIDQSGSTISTVGLVTLRLYF